MPEQLTFFGTWETVIAEVPLPEASPPPLAPTPVDPRQAVLFEGPHSCRRQAELACEALDAAGLRAAWQRAQALYPAWEGSRRWLQWAEGLELLSGGGGADRSAARVVQALALLSPEVAAQQFPEMPESRVQQVRESALSRAARSWQEELGAAAFLPDGRPPGALLLLAGQPEEAMLSLQSMNQLRPGQGLVLGYLGEALWRSGRRAEALSAYRDAYLHAPTAVDGAVLTCQPIMDLLDACGDLGLEEEGAWLPMVADLRGVAPLPDWSGPAPAGATPARRGAALLLAYRQGQRVGQSEAARLAHKRGLLALAPTLRELIRKL